MPKKNNTHNHGYQPKKTDVVVTTPSGTKPNSGTGKVQGGYTPNTSQGDSPANNPTPPSDE